MSRTIRRKSYEASKGKTHGSKVSGKGYYAQKELLEYPHPYKKRQELVYTDNPYYPSGKSYEWVETNDPYPVYVPDFTVWNEREFYKEYWKIHADNNSGDYSPPPFFVRSLNKKLSNEYKEYIHNLAFKGKEGSEPLFRKSAWWDWA